MSLPKGLAGDTLAARCRLQRLREGISMAELAARSGVAKSTVQAIENGRIKEPRAETIRRLADVFRCKPIWLLYGVNE